MFKPQFHPAGHTIRRIALDAIAPNPIAPRRRMSAESIRELADSIRRHGQLAPLLVRAAGEGYELISGRRRMKALKLLGRTHAEAVVLAANDWDSAVLALTENMHRMPIFWLDEAEVCRHILDTYPIRPEQLAEDLSIRPSELSDCMKLLRLPPGVRNALRRFRLSKEHARALLRLTDAGLQLALTRQAGEQRWSAGQLQARIEQRLHPESSRPAVSPVVRDNRIIINAITDTVRELNRIGVAVNSRVEERDDHIDVVVTIPIQKAAVRHGE